MLLLCGGSAVASSFGNVEGGWDIESEHWFADIVAGYEWGWLWLWGGATTLMTGGPKFEPFSVRYYVGGELTWKGLYLDVEHYCIHPVYSGGHLIVFYDERTTISIGYRWGEWRR